MYIQDIDKYKNKLNKIQEDNSIDDIEIYETNKHQISNKNITIIDNIVFDCKYVGDDILWNTAQILIQAEINENLRYDLSTETLNIEDSEKDLIQELNKYLVAYGLTDIKYEDITQKLKLCLLEFINNN